MQPGNGFLEYIGLRHGRFAPVFKAVKTQVLKMDILKSKFNFL